MYRRLNDLDPNPIWLEKAIKAFERSIEMFGGGKYLESLDSDLTDPNVKCDLLRKSKTKIITHHLAFSLTNLAETHICRYRAYLDQQTSDTNEHDTITHSKKRPADPNDIRKACKHLEFAAECYRKAVKKLHEERDKKWIEIIKEKERNMSLKDDLAWCLTLQGYALIKNRPKDPNDPNDHNEYYRNVKKILVKAKNRFRELRDVDESHRVLSLFALTVSQVELAKIKKQEQKEARKTFKEACLLLRRLTRE
ncbi:MAG: hypothetical protein ACYS67_09535, partial [Planctomycetota bacterium]